jgi:alpha-mannosidase
MERTSVTTQFRPYCGPLHIYLVPHSHIDVEWYWTFDKTRAWCRPLFGDMVNLLESNPAETFTQDQVPLLEMILGELGENGVDRLKALIERGQFEPAGGYIQPEASEPSGESLIRQLLRGREWMERTLDFTPKTGWFLDTFGQIPQIGQIVAGCGYRSYVFMRGAAEHLGHLPSTFLYRSPDGTEIPTVWLSSSYGTPEVRFEETLRTEITHASCPYVLVTLGEDLSNPADLPAEKARDKLLEIAREHDLPIESITIATPSMFFEKLESVRDDLPVIEADFSPPDDQFADLRGTYSNRVRLKTACRRAEQDLLTAEAWHTFAGWHSGHLVRNGDAQLDIAWEKLLYNQFHDILGASCTDQVYDKAMRRANTIIDLSDDVADSAIDALMRDVNTEGPDKPIAVMNPTSHTRTDVVEFEMVFRDEPPGFRVVDADGKPVPCHVWPERIRGAFDQRIATAHVSWLATDVPAYGYALYRIEMTDQAAPRTTIWSETTTTENEWFAVHVDPTTGDVARIIDRESNADVLSGKGNELLARAEGNPSMEGMVDVTGEVVRTSVTASDVSVQSTTNDLFQTVRSIATMPWGRVIRNVTLHRNVRRIDFQTRVEDLRGGDYLLTARFPLAIDGEGTYTYETPFHMAEGDDLFRCAQTVVDLSDGECGAAILNTGNAGHWPIDGGLELVLLRRVTHFGDYYSPAASESGDHEFTYSLVPHRGDWRESDVVTQGHAINRPLVPFLLDPHPGSLASSGSFLSVDAENVHISAVKPSNEGIVVRLWESHGWDTLVHLRCGPVASARLATMNEEPEETLDVADDTIAIPVGAHQVITVVITPGT